MGTARPCSQGSAYAYVLAVTLLLGMLAAAALAAASASREISARYPAYSGLYELAAGGNEQTLRQLQTELEINRAAIDADAREAIWDSDIMLHLVYRGGQFHLAFPADGYYAGLYQTRARQVLAEYIRGAFPLSAGAHRRPWNISVQITGPDAAAEKYEGFTEAAAKTGGYFWVSTELKKTAGGETGYPTRVEAEIIWPDTPHEEIFVPSYTWRERPPYFSYGLYASGDISWDESGAPPPGASALAFAPRFTDFVDSGRPPEAWAHDEPHIRVISASLDVSSLYEGDEPVPSFIFLTGGACEITASDPAKNIFNGVVLCFGGLTVNGVKINGTVMADGGIALTGPAGFTADPQALFKIPMGEPARQSLFDYLGLTDFKNAVDGAVNIETILGKLKFDLEAENGTPCTLEINNFDGMALSMIKLKKIAN